MLRSVVSIIPFPVPFVLLLLFIPFTSLAQDCNICGDGNYIGFPTGVVTITYNGVVLKNNCQTWSEIVKNPVAISDEYCRNELLNYTIDVCKCLTEDGDLVIDIMRAEEEAAAEEDADNGSDSGFGSSGSGGNETSGSDVSDNSGTVDLEGSPENSGEEGGDSMTPSVTDDADVNTGDSSAFTATTTITTAFAFLLSTWLW